MAGTRPAFNCMGGPACPRWLTSWSRNARYGAAMRAPTARATNASSNCCRRRPRHPGASRAASRATSIACATRFPCGSRCRSRRAGTKPTLTPRYACRATRWCWIRSQPLSATGGGWLSSCWLSPMACTRMACSRSCIRSLALNKKHKPPACDCPPRSRTARSMNGSRSPRRPCGPMATVSS
ncbi:hypothetical protein D3C71_1556250 [compost metagenome]